MLSSVKLTGYEEQFPDGCWSAEFNFSRLTPGGSTQNDLGNFFYWEDQADGNGGYWCDADGVKVDADNDYEFDAGEAVWFTSPISENDATFGFLNSGAVNGDDCTFILRDNGNVVGNPFPYVIKLSNVTIDNYADEFPDGCWSAEFNFSRLTSGGSTQNDLGNFFYWEDQADGNGGYWCDADGVKVDADNDYDIQIGEGVFFTAPIKIDPTTPFVLEFGAMKL